MRAERALAWLVAIGGLASLVLVGVETVAPDDVAHSVHAWLAPLCHQDPARCPVVHGHSLGACFRCLGVDVGFALVPFARTVVRRHALTLLGLGLLDWLLGQTGLGADLAIERFVLGIALGAGLGVALGAAVRRVLAAPRVPLRDWRRTAMLSRAASRTELA